MQEKCPHQPTIYTYSTDYTLTSDDGKMFAASGASSWCCPRLSSACTSDDRRGLGPKKTAGNLYFTANIQKSAKHYYGVMVFILTHARCEIMQSTLIVTGPEVPTTVPTVFHYYCPD